MNCTKCKLCGNEKHGSVLKAGDLCKCGGTLENIDHKIQDTREPDPDTDPLAALAALPDAVDDKDPEPSGSIRS